MNINKTEKNLDLSKINIGTEIECFIIHSDTFRLINKDESQELMKSLVDLGWVPEVKLHNNEIHQVTKQISQKLYCIKLDLSYAIFELASSPVGSLEELEALHKKVFAEFRTALKKHDFTIWPFGVAPSSNNLLKLPFKTDEIITDDNFYAVFIAIKNMTRLCHITSEQVSIDVPLKKIIPAINSLYKNLGEFIKKFANSPVLANGILYNEGRFYYWNDCDPKMTGPKYLNGVNPIFPKKPFKNLDDYFTRLWHSEYIWVKRNGFPHIFVDKKMTPHKWFKEKKGIAINENKEKVIIEFQKEDIELMFMMHWIDFKPHFDFNQSYTAEDFFRYYSRHDLDGFFKKYCRHSWIEIRPCSSHIENNAMDIPRYFYEIISNLDKFIKKSENISWNQARKARDKAVGYPKPLPIRQGKDLFF